MKHTLLFACFLAFGAAASAQSFIDIKAGLSTRFMPTGYVDAGIRSFDFSAAITTGFEAAMGANAGAIIGWQPRAVKVYAGYGWFAATNSKLAEGSRAYPIMGFQWKEPWGRGSVDIRYMGDAFHVCFGVTLGKQD